MQKGVRFWEDQKREEEGWLVNAAAAEVSALEGIELNPEVLRAEAVAEKARKEAEKYFSQVKKLGAEADAIEKYMHKIRDEGSAASERLQTVITARLDDTLRKRDDAESKAHDAADRAADAIALVATARRNALETPHTPKKEERALLVIPHETQILAKEEEEALFQDEDLKVLQGEVDDDAREIAQELYEKMSAQWQADVELARFQTEERISGKYQHILQELRLEHQAEIDELKRDLQNQKALHQEHSRENNVVPLKIKLAVAEHKLQALRSNLVQEQKLREHRRETEAILDEALWSATPPEEQRIPATAEIAISPTLATAKSRAQTAKAIDEQVQTILDVNDQDHKNNQQLFLEAASQRLHELHQQELAQETAALEARSKAAEKLRDAATKALHHDLHRLRDDLETERLKSQSLQHHLASEQACSARDMARLLKEQASKHLAAMADLSDENNKLRGLVKRLSNRVRSLEARRKTELKQRALAAVRLVASEVETLCSSSHNHLLPSSSQAQHDNIIHHDPDTVVIPTANASAAELAAELDTLRGISSPTSP